jgi:hypothetical protein
MNQIRIEAPEYRLLDHKFIQIWGIPISKKTEISSEEKT